VFNNKKVGAIIVAAGSASRMGGIDKIFFSLADKPILARVVAAFEAAPSVDQVVVVLAEHNLERGRILGLAEGWQKVGSFIPGGALRQDSVKAGLAVLSECEWIVIHDGARPLVTVKLIEEGLLAATGTGGAIAAVVVVDTIKQARSGLITSTLPRDELYAAQTPQVFRADILRKAYSMARGEYTDDASLVEVMGHQVRLFPGEYSNIKVTTPTDLALAEALWQRKGR